MFEQRREAADGARFLVRSGGTWCPPKKVEGLLNVPSIETVEELTSAGADVTSEAGIDVSVIVPTFNRRHLLTRAIDSVLAQTRDKLELLVIDDGSTDGTADLIACIDDPRLRYVPFRERRGAGLRRHQAVDLARGRYVAFLDSDDHWEPDKLDRQLDAIEGCTQRRAIVVCKPIYELDGMRFASSQPVLRQQDSVTDYVFLRGGALQTSGFLMPAAIAREIRFDPALTVHQDIDYLIHLEKAGVRFIYIDRGLYALDLQSRRDRMSNDPRLLLNAKAWFDRISVDWPPVTRRGYLVRDYAIRLAVQGRRGHALAAYARGFDPALGLWSLARSLVMALNGGRIPSGLATIRGIRRSVGRHGGIARSLSPQMLLSSATRARASVMPRR